MATPLKNIPREGNPNYPLPEDYFTLTEEGQRQARVNASRQWLLPGGPDFRAEARVAALSFFDLYYLQPEGSFNPLFYDRPPLPTPQFHWDMVRTWAVNRLNAAIAPRGSAKTTNMLRDSIMLVVTEPAYSVVYATSTHANAQHASHRIREQVYGNKRIHDDWGAEYGCRLKPARGEKPTGVEEFHLNNSSWVRCVSAQTRIRGIRPRRFRLDDPEYDESASTSTSVLRDYMDRLLFKLIIPMILSEDCGVDWVGTFVSKRHYLWHAMSIRETPEGYLAEDPRFNYWHRLWVRAAVEDPATGKLVSCWPERWPVSDEERQALNRPNAPTISEMRDLMGGAAFDAEMNANPGSAEDRFFDFLSDQRGRHAWWIENPDDLLNTKPHASESLICYLTKDGTTRKEPLKDFLKSCWLFTTVDTAYTEKASSDRRAVALMAVSRDNVLFVLDGWSDRKDDNTLMRKTFDLCERWGCTIIHVETTKDSFKLFQRFRSAAATKLTEDMGFPRSYAVKALKPGSTAKTAKIEALVIRFEHDLIKLPLWRRAIEPYFTRLIDQIEGFNPESPDGGLEKDDEIDTVSMSLFAIRGRTSRTLSKPREVVAVNALDEIKAGRLKDPKTGVSWATGVPLHMLTDDVIGHLLTAPPAKSPSQSFA